MKVAKLVFPRRMEVFDEPIPELTPGKALVKIRAAGICGSDVHYFLHGGLGSQKVRFPMAMGHEAAGEVVLSSCKVAVGTRVAVDPALACDECEYCYSGRFNLCQHGTFFGSRCPGAFQEYVLCDPKQLIPIPDKMSFEAAAMLEPLSVALHAVKLSGLDPGQSVAIFGAGAIGLCLCMVAREMGALGTVVIDPLEYRSKRAVGMFGAEQYWIQQFKHEEFDPCFDLAFDAAGSQESVDDACQCVVPGGKVVLVGIPTVDTLTYNPHLCRLKELTVISTRRASGDIPACKTMWEQGRIPLDSLITHRFSVTEVQKAFEIAASYEDMIIKGVLKFDG
jgi:L-iditol 2-dehydrogenase